jgi:hypothetical protein
VFRLILSAIALSGQRIQSELELCPQRYDGATVSKETKSRLFDTLDCFELLGESETLFVYVVIPVLCIFALCVLGIVLYQLVLEAHPADASAATDLLSIDPAKWFPRS